MGNRLQSALDDEFQTVDLVLSSPARTMSVDAFCLSWIKFERQLRKLTAHILYQATIFSEWDRKAQELLRIALARKYHLKHDHFIGGIQKLTGQNMKDIIGDRHRELRRSINRSYEFRNKIFHGQQTGHNLSRDELLLLQSHIREWCTVLAREASFRFGYDGFASNSLRKTHKENISTLVDEAIRELGWEQFVQRL
jgi:hypothetical protein